MKELIALLDPTLLTGAALFVLSSFLYIMLRAFHQNREVSFWPPKIGPRVDDKQIQQKGITDTAGSKADEWDSALKTAVVTEEERPSFSLQTAPDQEEIRMAKLPVGLVAIIQVLNGNGMGWSLLITAPARSVASMTVGRGPENDLCISDDRGVSRKHFEISILRSARRSLDQDKIYDDYHLQVTDLGSTNGTRLNGAPLSTQEILKNGDRISAGLTDFECIILSLPLTEHKATEAIDVDTAAI